MVHFLSCFGVYPQCHMAKYGMQELARFDCVIFPHLPGEGC